jgi:hypothetical protein
MMSNQISSILQAGGTRRRPPVADAAVPLGQVFAVPVPANGEPENLRMNQSLKNVTIFFAEQVKLDTGR